MDFVLDMQSSIPIYEQLRNQIVSALAKEKLKPGEKLPAVRRLASELTLNFQTVNRAYALLVEQGFVVTDRRRGHVISEKLPLENVFSEDMETRLGLLAAEAICRGMDYMNFIGGCMQAYRVAKGVEINE